MSAPTSGPSHIHPPPLDPDLSSLPLILSPDSQPPSPASSARVLTLTEHIRSGRVRPGTGALFLRSCSGLDGRGGTARAVRTYLKDMIDGSGAEPNDEVQWSEEEEEEGEEEGVVEETPKRPRTDKGKGKENLSRPSRSPAIDPSVLVRSPSRPPPLSPFATSTPADVRSHSQADSLSLSLSHPTLRPPSSPTRSQPSKPRFLLSPFRPPNPNTPLRPPRKPPTVTSSQTSWPYDSQFNVDSQVDKISRFLEEDAWEVERGMRVGLGGR